MSDEEQLKIAINTFVWMHAPGQLMLHEAESLASKIFILFLQARTAASKEPRPEYPQADEAYDNATT